MCCHTCRKLKPIDILTGLVLLFLLIGIPLRSMANKKTEGLSLNQVVQYEVCLENVSQGTLDAIAVGDTVYLADTDFNMGVIISIGINDATDNSYSVNLFIRTLGDYRDERYFLHDTYELVSDAELSLQTKYVSITGICQNIQTGLYTGEGYTQWLADYPWLSGE